MHTITSIKHSKSTRTLKMKDFQYITNSHPSYIENLYQDFVKNPESVDVDLRKFFEGFDFAVSSGQVSVNTSSVASTSSTSDLNKEFAVFQLIDAYRKKRTSGCENQSNT